MMLTGRNATTHRLMIFLVALSGLGVLVAGQQYMSLRLEETMVSARQTLEESFLSDSLRGPGSESSPELAQRLADRKTAIAGTYSGATDAIRYLEIRAIADFVGWCVVLSVSGWALIITAPKKPKPDEPSTASSMSDKLSSSHDDLNRLT
jgi:hypothetical protein